MTKKSDKKSDSNMLGERFVAEPEDFVFYPPEEDEPASPEDTGGDDDGPALRMSDDAEPLIPQEFGQRLGKLLKKKRTS